MVSSGDFEEAVVIGIDGPIHESAAFIDGLAARVMAAYESQPPFAPMELVQLPAREATRTKAFYRRLFAEGANPTEAFRTLASEVLALWCEDEFDAPHVAYGGSPHNTDPAFDLISLSNVPDGFLLRLTQVKATEGNLQYECAEALRGFTALRDGAYDSELWNRIATAVAINGSPDRMEAQEAFQARQSWLYRVVAVHAGDRAESRILTRFAQEIAGPTRRRTLDRIEIVWGAFWSAVAARVYEQLI